ncbi:hypothetical protein [Halorubrum laminariae]|uniref:Uncharacterized protein n=1 Tax=Halorubrum laminariae TaxID=1433523 RepID=A0ABD6C419_9EURY|nr:hypothetical protein [Halorubrum laminariae]
MDEDAVRTYADHAQATIEAAPQMDEANTKAALLRDFLDLLDWTIPDNTQLEYSERVIELFTYYGQFEYYYSRLLA